MGVFDFATDESLDNLILAAQAETINDTAAMAALLTRFEGMAMSIARSLTSEWNLQQDALQGARLGLVNAVRAHTVGKPGFPSFARTYMRGSALRTLSKMRTGEVLIDPTEYGVLDSVSTEPAVSASVEVIDLISVLTPEQRAIAWARYFDNASVTDIANRWGISKPAVSQRFATIHRTLQITVDQAVAA